MTKKFDPTKPVQTRDGRKARIICTDRQNTPYSIVALYDDCGTEEMANYTKDGMYYDDEESDDDLINIPAAVVDVFYQVVYADGIDGICYRTITKSFELAGSPDTPIGVVKITTYADNTFDIEKV